MRPHRHPRIAATCLAAALAVGALAGCGGRTDGGNPVPGGGDTTTSTSVVPGTPG